MKEIYKIINCVCPAWHDMVWHRMYGQFTARHKSLGTLIPVLFFHLIAIKTKQNVYTNVYTMKTKISRKCQNETKYRMTNVCLCRY